jgi:hypothetical protein
MVKRIIRNHRFVLSLIAINTFIVVEEFAHQHLYPPPNHWMGLGWYWTAVLSLPCSLMLYLVHWPWHSEFLSLAAALIPGALQWGAIGAVLDYRSRARHSSANT